MMKPDQLEAIRRFEGFREQARWDYAQHTNGYGTRALHPGEVIDKPEAERRFAAEIDRAMRAVERFAPGLDQGSLAALTSLTFNAGPGWMRSGLGDAVKAGDLDGAREILMQYVHAGGQRLAGLVARREIEAQWLGAGPPASSPVDAAHPQGDSPVPPSPAAQGPVFLAEPGRDGGLAKEWRSLPFAEALALAILAMTVEIRPASPKPADRDDARSGAASPGRETA